MEFLIILSITLLALLVFMSLTQSESVGISITKDKADASNSVRSLSAAADAVYSQGAGARKRVEVDIPFGYELNGSYISGNAIKLRASGNDFIEVKDFGVYGSFPNSAGKHEIWVVSEGEKVKIGNAMVQVNREAINVIFGRNDTRTESFLVSNPGNSTVTLSIVPSWNNPEVTMAVDDTDFLLHGASSYAVTASFSSSADAPLGFHSGYLNLTATDDYGNSETIALPVSVEVSYGFVMKGGPSLYVLPSSFNISLKQGESASKAFQVCTNSESSLSSVDFNPSNGTPGDWVGMIYPLSHMPEGTCQSKMLSISVPLNATPGNHTGYVSVEGNGAAIAQDVIVLDVIVAGIVNESDARGPVISDILVYPDSRKIFEKEPVAVKVVADDRQNGNNSIAGCQMKVDDGTWLDMGSADGDFDTPQENASHTFYSGFSMGVHNISARCIDANGNMGLEAQKNFTLMKEFLFVTETSNLSIEEKAWMDWIKNGLSEEGFVWGVDNVTSSGFIAGTPEIDYYTTVVVERYTPATKTRLDTFISSGGSVIFLGHAAASAPKAFGYSSVDGDNYTESKIAIKGSPHYITSGYSGTVTIGNGSNVDGRFWKDPESTMLASSLSGSPPHWNVLGIVDRQYFWGPLNPDHLTQIGINISIRTLDHAVNASGIGG